MNKNETIASLETQLKGMSKENRSLSKERENLIAGSKEFEIEIDRMHGVLKEKNVIISNLKSECSTKNMLIESCNKKIDNLIIELENALKKKQEMILTVNITGQDIDETLDNAVKMMESTLEKGGRKDKYFIIPVPHTMKVDIVR